MGDMEGQGTSMGMGGVRRKHYTWVDFTDEQLGPRLRSWLHPNAIVVQELKLVLEKSESMEWPRLWSAHDLLLGQQSGILFAGWPGARGGMYALALVAVFALKFLLKLLGCRGLESRLPASGNRRAAALAAVHLLRVGVAYLLMLALMSFNGGVLLVAVAGHAAGFLAFRAGLCGGGGRAQVEDGCKEEVAPAACC